MKLEVRYCCDFDTVLADTQMTGTALEGDIWTRDQPGIDVDPNHHLVPIQVNENTPTLFTLILVWLLKLELAVAPVSSAITRNGINFI